MFERYTEKARRVIFFARYEASQFGSPYIETQHLLLGILREDKALANRFLPSHLAVESIRKQIEANTAREKILTSVDLPLSHESKRVLAYGAEEAERLKHKHIGCEHLFAALLLEEKFYAAELLRERGVTLEGVRQELAAEAPDKPVIDVIPFTTDLTESVLRSGSGNASDHIVDRVIEILWRQTKNLPVLIADQPSDVFGVVERLAARIRTQEVPEFFFGIKTFSIDVARFATETSAPDPVLRRSLAKFLQPRHTLCYLAGSLALVLKVTGNAQSVAIFDENHTRRQFICFAPREEFRKHIENDPLLKRRFEAVEVNFE